MPPSNSPFAYEDIRGALERALDSKKGIKIKAATHGAAVGLRHRFNNYRRFDARQNAKIYPEGHQYHNRCPFDVLRLRIPKKGEPDDNVLFIEKRGIEDFNFEEIMDDLDGTQGQAPSAPADNTGTAPLADGEASLLRRDNSNEPSVGDNHKNDFE